MIVIFFQLLKLIIARRLNKYNINVLTSGRAQDPYLSACARNIWYVAALHDLDVYYVHVMGKINVVADLLSRWSFTEDNYVKLPLHVQDILWVQVFHDMLHLSDEL